MRAVPVIEPRKRLTRNQRTKMHDAHGSKCVICLELIPKGERFIDEHVIPLELGGTNDPSNRGPAHIGCAKIKTKRDQKLIAKAKRIRAKHIGVRKRKGRGFACGRDTPFKKKVSGEVVRR
jgi:5-methylcytosine-specific restriction protein A